MIAMRILGALLFVTGFFLLFTIILAGLGIFLMIVGFILMVVGGGRRRVVINNVVSVNSPPAALPREMQSDFVDAQPRAHRREPMPILTFQVFDFRLFRARTGAELVE
jgi:predicted membrane protein